MNNPLVAYEFDSEPVRVVMIGDEPWFVAHDVAKALAYSEAAFMTRILDDDEKGLHNVQTLGGAQEMAIISESGLYHAALKRRGQHAQRFRRWVTQEVLPSIRKTGAYRLHDGPPPTALLTMESAKISAWVGLLREARRLYGVATARQLWVQLGLPVAIAEAQADDPLLLPLREWLAGRQAVTIPEAQAGLGLLSPRAMHYERIQKLLTLLGWSPRQVFAPEAYGRRKTMWFGPDQALSLEDAA